MVKFKNCAFVDGSFNPYKGLYAGAAILFDQHGKTIKMTDRANDAEGCSMRNVAGEILGAMLAIREARDLGMTQLTIFYDYEGIAAWPDYRWMAKNQRTKYYKEYVNAARSDGLDIHFQHVRAHSGNILNDEADWLAKIAAEIL